MCKITVFANKGELMGTWEFARVPVVGEYVCFAPAAEINSKGRNNVLYHQVTQVIHTPYGSTPTEIAVIKSNVKCPLTSNYEEDLIIVFKEGTTFEQTMQVVARYELVVTSPSVGMFMGVHMPQRDFMGSADLEDLSEEECVQKLLWPDGTACRPRG